ncbi:helix-turn-helix domain-containing protein (plasmid) [Xanthomonas oryzae pv. oryzae]|nr:helix-turn-helix domain-containing protein [Xanthomonas oryzae pv. oryzae]
MSLFDLGNRIRELRKKQGISQEDFALSIDMDRSYFAGVEAGKRNISFNNLSKIIKGLGVSFANFFEGY